MTTNIADKKSDTAEKNLLRAINSPADLRRLAIDELPQLCAEIRSYLIDNLSQNPGHFGSSMGAVEIIVAMHYVFDTPRDRIVFDVGHQAYAHKLLTGRYDAFRTQRTLGGISGFPIPSESEYDTFVCGHAGNSISAALGMATADRNTPGQEDRKTVALIGDASISGGLAFEGLNNASNHPNNLLIVLNDNDMSIDPNVGAMHHYLSDITTSRRYNNARYRLYNFCKRHGLIKDKGKGLMLRFSNALKSLITGQQNIFDGLNIRYFGPFPGNDVVRLVKVLRDIKEMQGPRILHIHTQKGHGYEVAERNPGPWHAPGKFDAATGIREAEKKSEKNPTPNWQDVFGDELVNLAHQDERVCGITAAMPSGTSVCMLQREYPDRAYDVGISEGHAVTFAGGLAAAGKRPFVAIYSSFLQRALDNIIHDVCIQGLPVVFCLDRAGLVGEDGVTHHGLFDIPYLSMIPGLSVAAPMHAFALRAIMRDTLSNSHPIAIRYPRGKADSDGLETPAYHVDRGVGRTVAETPGSKVAILSVGPVGHEVTKALEALRAENITADHYDMIWIKPLDINLLKHIAETHSAIVTVEDGVIEGGFGSMVASWLADNEYSMPVTRLGVPDQWVAHGSISQLRSICHYDSTAIAEAVRNTHYPDRQ